MLGRMIERLFVQVRADLSQLSGELQQGVRQTQTATQQMARQWESVSGSIENLTADLRRGAITQGQYMAQMNRLASSVAALGGSYRQAQRQVHGYAASLERAAVAQTAAMNPARTATFARSAGQARMQMMNLGYQLNDISMTLATGMNPMTVMIQQGSQIAQIYGGQGGVNQLFKDLGRMVVVLARRLWPVALVVGAIATGVAALTRAINQTTDTTVTMGDTMGAVWTVVGRKLRRMIEGPLREVGVTWNQFLDFINEWTPRVMNAVIGVIVASTRIIFATWDMLPDMWHDTWAAIKNTTLSSTQAVVNFITQQMVPGIARGADMIINSFTYAFEAIGIVWNRLPDILGDAVAGAANAVLTGIEAMVNGAINSINRMIQALNDLINFVGADQALEFFGFSGNLPMISEADLSQWRMQTSNAIDNTAAELGEAAGRVFSRNMVENATRMAPTDFSDQMLEFRNSFSELGDRINRIIEEEMGQDFMGDFFDEVRMEAINNALERIAEGTEEIGDAAGRATDRIKEMMEELQQGLETAADNLAQVFGNAFERIAETGRFTFRDFIQDMNRLIIRSTSELLQQELSKMFQNLATSKGGLGSTIANLFTAIFGGGSFGGGSTKGIGKKQGGGIEMPWRSFVAGENGQELVTQDGPAGARRVASAGRTRHMMQGMGGYMGPPIIMNIQTPDVDSFRRSQGQLASRMSNFIARGRRNQ